MLYLITQQFSLLVPDLQAVPIGHVVISTHASAASSANPSD
jgi:hypothetical protein